MTHELYNQKLLLLRLSQVTRKSRVQRVALMERRALETTTTTIWIISDETKLSERMKKKKIINYFFSLQIEILSFQIAFQLSDQYFLG